MSKRQATRGVVHLDEVQRPPSKRLRKSASSSSPLLSLSIDLIGRIIQDLSIEDVGRLDTALCNHAFRPVWIRALSMQVITHDGMLDFKVDYRLYYQWAMKRHIKGTFICLQNDFEEEIFDYFCNHHPSTRRELTLEENCHEDATNTTPARRTLTKLIPLLQSCSELTAVILPDFPSLDDVLGITIATHCRKLVSLCLASTSVTDATLKALVTGCPSLKMVTFNNISTITGAGLAHFLRHMRQIEFLDVSDCGCMTQAQIHCITDSLPELRSLVIDNAAEVINDEMLTRLCEKCPHIHQLSVQGQPLTDEGIASLTKMLPCMTRLALGYCFQLSDLSAEYIGLRLLSLQELSLSCNNNIGETPFALMFESLKELEYIDLSYCLNVSDVVVKSIACHCEKVKELNMKRCTQLTPGALKELWKRKRSLLSLKRVDVRGALHIYDDDITAAIKSFRPRNVDIVWAFNQEHGIAEVEYSDGGSETFISESDDDDEGGGGPHPPVINLPLD